MVTVTLSPVLAWISCNLSCPCRCLHSLFATPRIFLLASSVSAPSVYLFVSVCFSARISQFPFRSHVSFILFAASISAAGKIDFYFALVLGSPGFCFAFPSAVVCREDIGLIWLKFKRSPALRTSLRQRAWLKSPRKTLGICSANAGAFGWCFPVIPELG